MKTLLIALTFFATIVSSAEASQRTLTTREKLAVCSAVDSHTADDADDMGRWTKKKCLESHFEVVAEDSAVVEIFFDGDFGRRGSRVQCTLFQDRPTSSFAPALESCEYVDN